MVRALEAFDGVWERMKRAKAHREAAAKARSTWLTDYEPYGEWLHIDDDGIGTLSIRQFSPPPAGIAIELGGSTPPWDASRWPPRRLSRRSRLNSGGR